MLTRLLPGLVVAAAAALAADPPEKTFDLALTRGAVPAEQRVMRVSKGDAVRLRLTSDAAGAIRYPRRSWRWSADSLAGWAQGLR